MSDESQLLIALEFAAHKHRDQRRKAASTSPCINHPIALARLLAAEAGGCHFSRNCRRRSSRRAFSNVLQM